MPKQLFSGFDEGDLSDEPTKDDDPGSEDDSDASESVEDEGGESGEGDNESDSDESEDESGDEESEDSGGEAGEDDDGGDEGEEESELIKLKIDGEEVEKPLEEIVAIAQKNLAADKRLAEAAEKNKDILKREADLDQLEQDIGYFRDQVLQDPIKTVRNMLLASGQYAEDAVFNSLYQYVQSTFKELVEEAKNPEKRQAVYAQERARTMEEENKRLKEEREKQASEAESKAFQEQLISETRQALKESELPDDDDTIADAIQVIIAADDDDKELTPAEAVSILKDRIAKRREKFLSTLTIHDLEKNPELLEGLRKADLEKIKKRSKKGATQATKKPATKPKKRAKSRKKSFSEMFDPWKV